MSIEASSWAWKVVLPAAEKLVLLALADHADQNGVCWPGFNGLIKKTCLARSSVGRSVNALESKKLIKKTKKHHGQQNERTIYQLSLRMKITPPSDIQQGMGSPTAELGGSPTAELGGSPTAELGGSPTAELGVVPQRNRGSPTVTPESSLNRQKTTTTPLILASVEDCKTTPLPPHGGNAREVNAHARKEGAANTEENPKERRRLDADASETQPPDPASAATGITFPDIIPDEERPALRRMLEGLSPESANDVLTIVADRLTRSTAGRAPPIDRLSGYVMAMVTKARNGSLDVPVEIRQWQRSAAMDHMLSELKTAWNEGADILVDGKPVRIDAWPVIACRNGSTTIAALLSEGAVVEASTSRHVPPPSRGCTPGDPSVCGTGP